MSDLVGDSYYEWTFLAGTGDRYAGFLYDDTGAYAPGQVLPTAYGHYRIGAALPYGYDLGPDRKSTRLNSSHANISYAVFCLTKQNTRTCSPSRISACSAAN